MSILLNNLIQNRKTATEDYQNYLQKIVELTKQVHQPNTSSAYPESLNTPAKIALSDNLDKNEELALTIDAVIRQTKQDGWRGNRIKEKEVKNAIKKYLPLPEEVDNIMEIVKNQSEY